MSLGVSAFPLTKKRYNDNSLRDIAFTTARNQNLDACLRNFASMGQIFKKKIKETELVTKKKTNLGSLLRKYT